MSQPRVLIVDDDFAVGDALGDILRRQGYDVTVTESPAAALEKGKKTGFDLLLADLKMPEMSGLELVRRFQELDPQIVPILITGYPSFETIATAIEVGAYDYITKPIDKDGLRAAVTSALQKRRRTSEGAREKAPAEEPMGRAEELAPGPREEADSHVSAVEILVALRNSELFATLSNDELLTIASLCREETYGENETICQQGERSEKLYVTLEGTIALNRFIEPDMKAFVTVGILKEGKVFCWTAFIAPHVHTVSAVCLRPTKVLAINGAELELVLQRNPRVGFEVMQRLATILGERVRASYDILSSRL